jgi:tRNA(fMet)-specific endonuclease VapC
VGLILDSSVLISAERETFDLPALLASAKDDAVAIAAVTASELLHGVERARDSAARSRRSQTIEGLLADFVTIPFGLHEARIHARIWATLAAKGRMIGAHDLLVAATAISVGSDLVTLNQKEFRRVPGLRLTPISRFVRR